MKTAYDTIVVGCGGIGSAALYWLARAAGADVLGLERFHCGHDHGASQDHSRIIRLSYDAPEYVALAPHTYTAWRAVEDESGVQLVVKTGGLDLAVAGTPGFADLDACAASMDTHGVPYESLTARELMHRWPQFRVPDSVHALYQADGGLVDARKANAAHIVLARAHGATIRENAPVRAIRPDGENYAVETDDATFTARRVIVAADAWTNQVLDSLGVQWPLRVTQEQVTYFATPRLRDFAPDRFPIWIWRRMPDEYYGFPVYGEVATKAGQDCGGEEVTADTRTFTRDEAAHDRLHDFLAEYIPGFLGPELYTKTCLYTMPPDRNFIIGALPEHPGVIVAQGAAHAFKFACLIGRILRDLAIEGKTPYPIDAFRPARPILASRNFQRIYREEQEIRSR